MSIIVIILTLAVVAFVVYLITTYIPMDPPIKLAIQVIALILVLLWFLQTAGVVGPVLRIG